MFSIDEFGSMEVEVDGRMERRQVEINHDAFSANAFRSLPRPVPVLHDGEILCERIGMPPLIVRER